MFKVSPAILQTFIDTPNCVLEGRVLYSTIHIPNVFCDGHLQLINCVGIVLYCNRQAHRKVLITLYNLFPKIISAIYVEFVRNECIEEDLGITSFVFVITLSSYMEQNMMYALYKDRFVTL